MRVKPPHPIPSISSRELILINLLSLRTKAGHARRHLLIAVADITLERAVIHAIRAVIMLNRARALHRILLVLEIIALDAVRSVLVARVLDERRDDVAERCHAGLDG